MLKKLKNRYNELKLRVKSLRDGNNGKRESKIEISVQDDLVKVEIKDYISLVQYEEEVKNVIDTDSLNKISFNIMWNSLQQKINKGIYYVLGNENYLYNVLITETTIEIDERIKSDGGTEERIIRFNTEDKSYRYSSLKHDKIGSTYYLKFYNKDGCKMKDFALDKEVAFHELETLLGNIEKFDSIWGIINIESLREYILGDFGVEFLGTGKKKV